MGLKKTNKQTSRNIILSLGSIAVVIAICLTVNMRLPFGKSNIVYAMNEAKVKVPFNLEIEKNEQKSVDSGRSLWKLNPIRVSQIFVTLKLSPQGITGDYPIKTEDLKFIQKNDAEAVVEVSGSKTPISKVYLERLVRQDSTGIWTVVGYDPK
jgi:ribosome maturation protein Sdo1